MYRLSVAAISLTLSLVLASCSPVLSTWVDGANELTFAGQTYRGISGTNFVIERAGLVPAGEADAVSDTTPAVFRFPDIDSDRVVVAFRPTGAPSLFVPLALLASLPAPAAESSHPLAAAIPELCRYWRPPEPLECER